MKNSTFIYIEEFCTIHNIETSLVHQLVEFEILTLKKTDNKEVIELEELPKLEKMVRLHQELEINPQGLQAIHHLLEQVNKLQEEILALRRKLNRFEE
ncbi:chaperone modulator CbpM [Maribacter sp. PR1]|uniref:Chaperone modulator CbpM n=1 Tax=Maribacter cobaltidurans TaxID=1178778 RepID=A0ABU7IVK2_9FLAO|nr:MULTISPECIES: chaperone modulator CbpM [Maribacter]MDC6389595.1 chaperone modulator CbpM [Maribacter sp. PR1]MEE1976984.1 chaperone modulator CbpM [Maribacter cobaltidurans]